VSTALLDPLADELVGDRLWPPRSDLEAATLAGVGTAEVSLDRRMIALLHGLDSGDPVACLACGDPSGLRAAPDGGAAACCNCGSTLS
jgi:hypothetical protein